MQLRYADASEEFTFESDRDTDDKIEEELETFPCIYN